MPGNSPIGIFDSGFGGLTIFKKIREKLARGIAGGIGTFARKYQRTLGGSEKRMCMFKKSVAYLPKDQLSAWVLFIVALLTSLFLFYFSIRTDLKDVTNWLIGINFTIAFFSMNFTFLGYNLSPYKTIWRKLNKSQWEIIGSLLILPIVPIAFYLFNKLQMSQFSIAFIPIILYFAISSYINISNHIDPANVIKIEYSNENLKKYSDELILKINTDLKTLEINRQDGRTKPFYTMVPSPLIIEHEITPLWEKLINIIKIALDNNDFEIFDCSFQKHWYLYRLLLDNKQAGIAPYISKLRMKEVLNLVDSSTNNIIYMEYINNVFCRDILLTEEFDFSRVDYRFDIINHLEYLCKKVLLFDRNYDLMKTLKSLLHYITNLILFYDPQKHLLGDYFIASHIKVIKRLGQYSISSNKLETLYRCFETLGFIGCDCASRSYSVPALECVSSLVQLGRESKHHDLKCFWDRCLMSPHIHAEENIGNILTWFVKDKDASGNFSHKFAFETAFSRIRGYECTIEPLDKMNPKFWIKIIKDKGGKPKPHIESEQGMFGYMDSFDYSDFNNLKEYHLIDI